MSGDRLDWQGLIETALTVEGAIGGVYNRFYEYSFLNQMLLRMQGVIEPVATYDRWKSIGRQVLKGSKAKEIVRPIFIEVEDESGEPQRITRFKPVRCIFGLSDTDGPELPPAELPGWELDQALDKLDVRQVPFRSLDGNTQGYASGREVAVNPVAVYPTRTLMHELGHVVLGHTVPARLPEYLTHTGRSTMEFQAEATSYLTMNELEQLDEASAYHSRGYIQHWLGEQRPSDAAIRQVFSATDKILRAGRAE